MQESTDRQRWDLTLRLLSPMQIGAGTLGMIEKTELFIPGRVLWGALTNMLARRLCQRPRRQDFQEIGEALGKNGIFIAAFFPSLDFGGSVWRPRFVKNGNERKWINSSDSGEERGEAEMRRMLTCSVASNATDPNRLATSSKSLHATDMIAPVFRDQTGRLLPVCFRGRLDLPKTLCVRGQDVSLNEDTIEDVLNNARLGGGRKRGWGRIKVVNIEPVNINQDLHAMPCPDAEGTWLLTPDRTVEEDHVGARGRAFLAVYRQYDNTNGKGYGRAHTTAKLCWEIGTVLPS